MTRRNERAKDLQAKKRRAERKSEIRDRQVVYSWAQPEDENTLAVEDKRRNKRAKDLQAKDLEDERESDSQVVYSWAHPEDENSPAVEDESQLE